MDENLKLTLVKEENFLGIKCNFYKDDKNNIYMTREQIGIALQYSEPRVAITKIHSRNKERLDKFSGSTKLVSPEGGTQNTIIYQERGIYEIARFSRQLIANQFYDWVYEQIELIRKTGAVIDNRTLFIETYCGGMTEEQKGFMISFMAKIEEQQEQIKNDKPKVESWMAFMDAKGNLTMSNVSKALNIKGLGRNKLFELLRKNKILMSNNEPYQPYIERGYFEIIVGENNGFKYNQTVVTGKGIEWLNKKIRKWIIV